jgi:ubiquinone/menaquinone biosynthesis C-methylase UbiE
MSFSASQPIVYAQDHSRAVLRTHSWRTVANSATYLRPHIQPHMSILDVGCGPGSITVDLAKLVPQGRVVGIEYSPEPLKDALAFAQQQGVTNAEFQVGDIHKLDFPDNTFDIVHAHQVLQHVADPVQALREMKRVCKKDGGIMAVRESAKMLWYPESQGLEHFWEVATRMGRLKGSNPHPGYRLHVWAQEAGFTRSQITCSSGTWCFASPEERAYWGESMEERTLSSVFATNATELNLATQEELKVMAKAWRTWIEDDNGWFSVLHGEIICRNE